MDESIIKKSYLDILGAKMKHDLLQVRYSNGQEGSVDDITLNELILSHKIEHSIDLPRKSGST